MHGCKEGQCGSCKSRLIDGDLELMKYSTFALPDYEKETDHVLLCRAHAFSDITVELLNYDEDLLRRAIAVREFAATVTRITALDPRHPPARGRARGAHAVLGRPVCRPDHRGGLHHPRLLDGEPALWKGRGSSSSSRLIRTACSRPKLDGVLAPGDRLVAKGPYGTCFRREARPGPMLLVGGGSGMSPLWSILMDHIESGEQRPVRFFYGARTRADLFRLDELAAIARRLPDFPASSPPSRTPIPATAGKASAASSTRSCARIWGLSGSMARSTPMPAGRRR